jgi:hypothetical protein
MTDQEQSFAPDDPRLISEQTQEFTPEEVAAFEREQRREQRANAAVASKAKKIHAQMLTLERFAMRQGVIFMTFHEILLSSIHRLELFISDYDPNFIKTTDAEPDAPEAEAPEAEEVETTGAVIVALPDEILPEINRRMEALSLGECAIVGHDKGDTFFACLYFSADFRDSRKVAGWFQALGATSVVIEHTLYSDVDDDRDGLTHGCQAWTVHFELSSRT